MPGKIIYGNFMFEESDYDNEKELQSIVVNNKEKIFGEDNFYFDIKKTLSTATNNRTIPDGMLLSLSDEKFWLIEYEMANHSIVRHTLPQLMTFVQALDRTEMRNKIADILYERIMSGKKYLSELRSHLQGREIFHFLTNVLQKRAGIIIVTDKEIPNFKEGMGIFSGVDIQVWELTPFENMSGDKLYFLNGSSHRRINAKAPTIKKNQFLKKRKKP